MTLGFYDTGGSKFPKRKIKWRNVRAWTAPVLSTSTEALDRWAEQMNRWNTTEWEVPGNSTRATSVDFEGLGLRSRFRLTRLTELTWGPVESCHPQQPPVAHKLHYGSSCILRPGLTRCQVTQSHVRLVILRASPAGSGLWNSIFLCTLSAEPCRQF